VNASIVIRVRNGMRHGIDDLIAHLLTQHGGPEVIVVDSGSTDGTLECATGFGVEVLQVPRSEFSFGRALNRGADSATGEVIVALSADAFPRDDGWVAAMVSRFEDPAVACVFGETRDWAGRPLEASVRQDAKSARSHPFWGYSNGAGAFRADLWRDRPFREDLPGCEDREWALWALEERGMVCLLDPALAVAHDHSRDGLRASFRRYEREARGYSMFLDLPPYGAREALGEWWGDQGWHRSRARARLDPRRLARLAGKWRGRR
jgi:glycosyltransferase involved in cell wall biosynthesis